MSVTRFVVHIDYSYIVENVIEGGGVQKGSFFFKKPSGFCERIPHVNNKADAIDRCVKRYIPEWNHTFDIVFSVSSHSEDPSEVTAEEVIEGLERRLENLKENPQEALEAIGYYNDTYNNWT